MDSEMDVDNAGDLPFGQPQSDLGTSAHGQQPPDELGSGHAPLNSEGIPSGEHGTYEALSNPAGQAPLFGAGDATAPFEPFTQEMAQSIPALDFNGFILHAAPRPVPEELQRDSSGASVAEPDAVLDEENGRTYHNYHEGRYYLPNDAAEQDRLDLQHKLWQVHLDDELFKAPIPVPPKNVLDVATGTGIWAIQMAKKYPTTNVIGTDLSLIQPEGPPNCSFIKEDAELDEWTLPVVFDYIHLRMVHTCFDDYRALFRKCYDNLEPGGWIELQDAVFKLMCTDGTADGSNIERFSQLILQGGQAIGRDLDIPGKYKDMLIETGFLDVVEDVAPVPGNPWPDEAKFKSLGYWQMINSHRALRGFGWKLFRKLGMEPDDIEDLVEKAKTDITDSSLHFFFPIYVVYGRKPYEWELEQPPQKRARN